MDKKYKSLRDIIQHPNKKEILLDLIMEKLKSELKEIIEEIILEERAIFCEEEKDVGNGFYTRDLKTSIGEIEEIKIPRTREKSFKPALFEPYSRTSFLLEDLIIAMYQEGCSTRDVTRVLERIFEIKYSPTSVSRLTYVVKEKIEEFKKRRIDKWYPIIYVDGTYLKMRRDVVEGEVVHVVLGISEEGHKEILGFWITGSNGESAINWREIFIELKERGLEDPLLFVGDGLPGLVPAIKEVYPKAEFQFCVLHKVRASLQKVRKRDREAIAYDLKKIYKEHREESFMENFEHFKNRWGKTYPDLVKSWKKDLDYLKTYLRYPYEIREMIYTTNILERFIKEVKRRTKVIEVFPDENSLEKVLYLVSVNMNERYKGRKVKNFELVIEELRSIRRARYKGKQEFNNDFESDLLDQVLT